MAQVMNKIIYVVAKAPNWMLSLVPQGRDVLGVQIQDVAGVFTKDATGNSKGTIIKKDQTFTYVKLPVKVTTSDSIITAAKVLAASYSPVYVEKRINRKVGTGFYERTMKLWSIENLMILDVDQLIDDVKIPFVSKQPKKVVEDIVVEEPGDDKLEAYQALGFVDVGVQPTQQAYSLPTDDQLIDAYIESSMYDNEDDEDFESFYQEKKLGKAKKFFTQE